MYYIFLYSFIKFLEKSEKVYYIKIIKNKLELTNEWFRKIKKMSVDYKNVVKLQVLRTSKAKEA